MVFNDGIQLPTTIKIAGITYTVVRESIADEANIMFRRALLKVNDEHCQEVAEEALWHEVVEIINNLYELKLKHHKIQSIGAALHQISKDNDLSFMYSGR